MNSIITDNMECCYICGTPYNIHIHHCLHGSSNRKQADKYGLIVPLCIYHHTGSSEAVHRNRQNDLELIKQAQLKFEYYYSHDEWMKVFGKNYL